MAAALLTVACLVVTSCSRADDLPASAAVADPPAGPLLGAETPFGRSFLGVPYASPPVGELRWRPPVPAPRWDGRRDATRPGAPCPQMAQLDVYEPLSDEDCLTLDVYEPPRDPDRPGEPRPVLVWVHGGSFVIGAARHYDARRLAAQAGAVVVVVNYRLGSLGYLALPALAAEQGGETGNYGLQDVIAALTWAQENIAAFGGDPTNVTVAGQSAGGINVCALLASPAARGLFHRAIVQSAPCDWSAPVAEATARGADWAAEMGCGDPASAADCLRALPAEDLVRAQPHPGGMLDPPVWLPVSGGDVLPLPLGAAIDAGRVMSVPLLMGTVRDEARWEVPSWDLPDRRLDDAALGLAISSVFTDRAAEIEAPYLAEGTPPQERLARILTDYVFACPAERLTIELTSGRSAIEVFRYEFDAPHAAPLTTGVAAGSTHGSEIPYLFPVDDFPSTDVDRELSTTLIGYWANFIRTGSPSPEAHTGDRPRWLAYAPEAPHVLELVPGGASLRDDFGARHHCDVWN